MQLPGMGVRWLSTCGIMLAIVIPGPDAKLWVINIPESHCHQFAKSTDQINQWTCDDIASTKETVNPYVGVPWTNSDCERWQGPQLFGTQASSIISITRLAVMNVPSKGALCFYNNGSATSLDVGHSTCSETDGGIVVSRSGSEGNNTLKQIIIGNVPKLFNSWYALIGRSSLSLPRDVYFLCGHWAYQWLPVDWTGTCYIGSVTQN
ncbi:hypothetical protein FKM82_009854 [Ascaphus truei]